jgi:hypothetical protein
MAAVVIPAGHRPVHIDAHQIPANPTRGEPDHRTSTCASSSVPRPMSVELQTEEVTAAAWRYADTIENETLRSRVTQALR